MPPPKPNPDANVLVYVRETNLSLLDINEIPAIADRYTAESQLKRIRNRLEKTNVPWLPRNRPPLVFRDGIDSEDALPTDRPGMRSLLAELGPNDVIAVDSLFYIDQRRHQIRSMLSRWGRTEWTSFYIGKRILGRGFINQILLWMDGPKGLQRTTNQTVFDKNFQRWHVGPDRVPQGFCIVGYSHGKACKAFDGYLQKLADIIGCPRGGTWIDHPDAMEVPFSERISATMMNQALSIGNCVIIDWKQSFRELDDLAETVRDWRQRGIHWRPPASCFRLTGKSLPLRYHFVDGGEFHYHAQLDYQTEFNRAVAACVRYRDLAEKSAELRRGIFRQLR